MPKNRKSTRQQRNTVTPAIAQVVRNGRTTHFLVPIEEYERLLLADLAAEADRKLSHPKARWMTTEAMSLRLAGSRIATARKHAGLTQQTLAQRLGITQSEVSRIESSPDRSTIRTLKRIARTLKVDVRSLIEPEPGKESRHRRSA